MKYGYDGTGLGEVASIASKYAMLALSTGAAARLQISPDTFGVSLPMLFTAMVGALLSLLFMEPLQGKQRRFLPLTVASFAVIGVAIAVFLQTFKYTAPAFATVPGPMLSLILAFAGHRLIPLMLVDGGAALSAALKERIAKWRAPNA